MNWSLPGFFVLHFMFAVNLELKKRKSVSVSTSPSICCELMGLDAKILDFNVEF